MIELKEIGKTIINKITNFRFNKKKIIKVYLCLEFLIKEIY